MVKDVACDKSSVCFNDVCHEIIFYVVFVGLFCAVSFSTSLKASVILILQFILS